MADERVEAIRRRHEAFIEQYSPGPDWEPCNQMSLDRGWLLTALAQAEQRLKDVSGWAGEKQVLLAQLAQAERERDELTADLNVQRICTKAAQADLAQAERERDEIRQALEPGTAPRIVAGMFAEAEKRGMSPFIAKHALAWLCEQLDAARAEVKRLKDEARTFEARWMAAANEVERLSQALADLANESVSTDHVDALEADLARVDREREDLAKRLAETEALCNGYFDEMHVWAEKHREARAEVERLKEEKAAEWRQFLTLTRDEQIAELERRWKIAEAALARVRAVAEKIFALDISPTFDAKGTYSRRKSEELRGLQAELRAALEGRA